MDESRSRNLTTPCDLKQCGVKCRSKYHLQEMVNAAIKGNMRQVQLCLSTCHNALTGSDLFGRTVLHVAATRHSTELLHWLLTEKNPDKEAKDFESSWTSLHRALFYGQISAARMLVLHDASLHVRDNEGLTPLDILIKDRLPFVELVNSGLYDVYTWGNNNNFTLGHDGGQSRKLPEVIEGFRRNAISIKQVVMNKYHTVFLSTMGKVYTCGHGQGGRLGHGNEQTCVTPKLVESLDKEVCVKIAASRDNTFMLTESGVVYSCGLNEHRQLGQIPAPAKSLLPGLVGGKKLKGVHFTGICSQRFHGVIYNNDAIYTFGLNAGQLGHIKVSGEVLITQPKLVTAFNYDSMQLNDVVSCEAATLVITSRKDINLLYQFQSRRILAKNVNVVGVRMCGGELDGGVDNKGQLVDKSADELTVLLLSSTGKVHLWRASWGRLRRCSWDIKQQLNICDAVLKNGSMALITSEGQAYVTRLPGAKAAKNVTFPSLKEQQTSLPPTLSFSPTLTNLVAWDDIVNLHIKQIPLVHRAIGIATDNKSHNFAVLQTQPHASLTEIPSISVSTMSQQFANFLTEADPYDNTHDVILHVGHEQIAAHKFVLACRSNFFRKLFLEKKDNVLDNEKAVIDIPNAHPYVFRQILHYIYTDVCDLLKVGYEVPTDFFDAKKDIRVETNKVDKMAGSDPLKLMHKLAVTLGVPSILKKLELVEYKGGMIQMIPDKQMLPAKLRFQRQKFSELCDVEIRTTDDGVVKCHKCILVARSEYFNKMLTSGWIEASQTKSLTLPVTEDILGVVVDYLYTDDSAVLSGYRDIEFICNVLVTADQLLMSHLKQICEVALAGMITLKTSCELLEFASLYLAEQLAAACKQFIIINLPTLLEARSLNILSDGVIEKLTSYYRDTVPGMSRRSVCGYGWAPSQAQLEELEAHFRDIDLERLEHDQHITRKSAAKSRRRKSHRRSTDGDQTEKSTNTNSGQQGTEQKITEGETEQSASLDSKVVSVSELETKDGEVLRNEENERAGGDAANESEPQNEEPEISRASPSGEQLSEVSGEEPAIYSLRDIIAQEEKLAITRNKSCVSRLASKKHTKISQKAKKKKVPTATLR